MCKGPNSIPVSHYGNISISQFRINKALRVFDTKWVSSHKLKASENFKDAHSQFIPRHY